MPATRKKSVQRCVRLKDLSVGASPTVKRVLAALVLAVGFGAHARGSVIEYQFSGIITSADPSTGVAAGTPFTGTFSYDTATISPGPGYEGDWQVTYGGQSPSAANTFSLQVGGKPVVQESGVLGLSENFLQFAGQYGYHDGSGNPMPAHTTFSITSGGAGNLSAGLTLSNPSSWFPIDSNEIGGLNLGQLPNASLQVFSGNGSTSGSDLYEGKLTSLMTVPLPAPEPGTVSVFVVCTLWLVSSRRRGKTASR